MALLQMTFLSEMLKKSTQLHIYIPNDTTDEIKNENYHRNAKVLYLLHGFTGSSIDWVSGSLMQEMAMRYNLVVIMPSGDNSFYLNQKGTGRAYCDFVGKELVEYIRKTFYFSDKREDTFIGGLSMGGFGAIHTGFSFPETFSKIIGLSSALIIHDIKGKKENFSDNIADYDYYTSVFGKLDELEQSVNNPEYLAKQLKMKHAAIPNIYMACGTEDFLIQQNRAFYEFLREQNVDVEYIESEGMHDWKFWNVYLEESIKWALQNEGKQK